MAGEQNQRDYRLAVDEFFDSVYEGSRLTVLDGFEELADQVVQNLEEFHGYDEVDLRYTGPMAETFAGPVMDGPAMNNSRSYRVSAEEETEFEIKVKDTSMAFMSSGEGLTLDRQNEYRDIVLSYGEGSEQLYTDFTEEFRNILGLDSSDYQREEEKGRWLFKFQREDVNDIEGL